MPKPPSVTNLRAKLIVCPFCEAGPYQNCRNVKSDKEQLQLHKARIQAYEQRLKEQAS